MDTDDPVIDINNLHRRFGSLDAVNGLSLQVRPGRCYGFFGRNGAGKTTTIKCLLDLLRPTAGAVRVFGLDPHKNEVAVKSRFTYVPDSVAFYPWMTVRDTLDYLGSFRPHWNDAVETDLLRRFELDPGQTRRPSGFLCFCPWLYACSFINREWGSTAGLIRDG